MFPPIRLRQALNLGGLSLKELAVRTWAQINENEILTRAAAVAFYAMLAIVPFLALVLTLAVQALPDINAGPNAQGVGQLTVGELQASLEAALPPEALKVVQDQIARIQQQPPVGLLSIGLAVTIWLASSLFLAVIDAMNRIYGVRDTRSFLKLRLTAITMTLIEATILIGSLVAVVAWPQILGWLGLSQVAAALATAVQISVIVIMILMSFALCLYVGPDANQRWEWITPGSLFGTIGFLAITFGFRFYVQYSGGYDKTYGSLGGVMVLLFWFWLTSVVLLTSAQINQLIEEASPLGRSKGNKSDTPPAEDDLALMPDPALSGR